MTPYKILIEHYEKLVNEINQILEITSYRLEQAKIRKDNINIKEFIHLKSQLTAMKYEHEEGLEYWKKKEKDYLKVQK